MKKQSISEILIPDKVFARMLGNEVTKQIEVYKVQKTISPSLTSLEVNRIEKKTDNNSRMVCSAVRCFIVSDDDDEVIASRDRFLKGMGYRIGAEGRYVIGIFFTAKGVVKGEGAEDQELMLVMGMTSDGRQILAIADPETEASEVYFPKEDLKDDVIKNEVAVLHNFFEGYKDGITGNENPEPDLDFFNPEATGGSAVKLNSIN